MPIVEFEVWMSKEFEQSCGNDGGEFGTPAFCIYIDTLLEGTVPSVRDEKDLPCVFTTRVEAEREIADNMMTRLQEFMDGHRDFDDAMTVEEYVVEVDVFPDGSITDEAGNVFGSRRGGGR
ncbi:MAG: hypothetical protein ACREJC_04360 [Tepidisphaeraceae bacterium]